MRGGRVTGGEGRIGARGSQLMSMGTQLYCFMGTNSGEILVFQQNTSLPTKKTGHTSLQKTRSPRPHQMWLKQT